MGFGKIKLNEDFQNDYPHRMDKVLEFLMDKEWDIKKLDNGETEFTVKTDIFSGKTREEAEEYIILFEDDTDELAFRKESEIISIEI